MPRYIDIEPEIQELQSVLDERKDDANSTVHYTFKLVLRKLKSIPTADVAPRAEVAREIFEEIDNLIKEYVKGDIDGNTIVVKLYMLKKKYTEEVK